MHTNTVHHCRRKDTHAYCVDNCKQQSVESKGTLTDLGSSCARVMVSGCCLVGVAFCPGFQTGKVGNYALPISDRLFFSLVLILEAKARPSPNYSCATSKVIHQIVARNSLQTVLIMLKLFPGGCQLDNHNYNAEFGVVASTSVDSCCLNDVLAMKGALLGA